MNNVQSNSKPEFTSIENFKSLMGISSFQVLRRNEGEANQTTFISFTINGQQLTLRAQADLDVTKHMCFITSSKDRLGKPDWSQACLINAEEGKGAEILGSF